MLGWQLGQPISASGTEAVVDDSFRINSVSNVSPRALDPITIYFDNPAGALSIVAANSAIDIVNETPNSLTINVPHPLYHGDKSLDFMESTTFVVSDGTTQRPVFISIQPEIGYIYGKITTPDTQGIYADDGPGIVAGVSVYGQVITGDLEIDLGTGLSTNTIYSEFRYALSDGVWSDWVDPNETFVAPEPNNPATGVPTISGIEVEGETLTGNTDAINDADGVNDFVFEWLREGQAINGATGINYTLLPADVGSVIQFAVSFLDDNDNLEGPLLSIATQQIAPVPNNPATGIPTISGIEVEGETLTGNTDAINDADGVNDFVFQWLREGQAINGATGINYNLLPADVGSVIQFSVSFLDDNDNLEGPLVSVATNPIDALVVNNPATGIPTISGIEVEGETLTGNTDAINDADGVNDFVFQWLREGQAINGATGINYNLLPADVGLVIQFAVSFLDDNDNLEGPLISAPTEQIQSINSLFPVISGPGNLSVSLPADQTNLDINHIDVQNWISQWSAMDKDNNSITPLLNVPLTMSLLDSPIPITITAVDSESRVSTRISLITIRLLSVTRAISVFAGSPDQYEQQGDRFFLI